MGDCGWFWTYCTKWWINGTLVFGFGFCGTLSSSSSSSSSSLSLCGGSFGTACNEASTSPIRRRQADAADEDTKIANYLTGFEHAIANEGDDAMQKMYSLDNASSRQLVKAKIAKAITEFGEKPGDTGSTQVQVAVLHTKIVALSEHCNANRQDKHSRRGLEIMMEKRRKLLQYLKRKNFAKYNDVIKRLKLRPVAGIRWECFVCFLF